MKKLVNNLLMKTLTLFFLLVIIQITCSAQPDKITQQSVDSLLSMFIKQTGVPGLSVAVVKNNELIYSKSFGLSDIGNNIPAKNENKYRIGSVTKLFTAVATVKLIQLGIINADDAINNYIKNLPAGYKDITIAQLASHQSGIRHYTKNEIFSTNNKEYSNLNDALEKFINDTLLFIPGSRYQYSSYGYVTLGAVLEEALNSSFNEIIKEHVLQPADLSNTIPEYYNTTIENAATFYYPSRESSGYVIAQGDNYSYKWPAGGYLSAASDLAFFGSALLSGRIVDTTFLPLLFNSQILEEQEFQSGFGFRIGSDSKGRKVVHHGGEAEGGRAFLLIYPDYHLTIALLANLFRAPLLEGEAETISGYFLNDYDFDRKISGKFTYTAQNNDTEMTGTITVKNNNGELTDFLGSNLPIAQVVNDNEKTRIIALSPSGIINIWLNQKRDGYEGYWGYDKPINKIKLIETK